MLSLEKPTIVVVHGAWHVPPHYTLLTTALSMKGYPIITPLLPSCAYTPTSPSSRHDVSVTDDATVLRSSLEPLLAAGKRIVLVLHSYGGIPGTAASAGLGFAERKAQGLKGGIVRLVYLAAFLHAEGVALDRLSGGEVPPVWRLREDGALVVPEESAGLFYTHGVSEERIEAMKKLLVPHSRLAQATGADKAGWRGIESTYVYATLDVLIPVEYQERMVREVREEGAVVEEVRCATGHSSWMVDGEEGMKKVIGAIAKAAEGA